MFNKITGAALSCVLLLGLAACSSDAMSPKDVCSEFDSIIKGSAISGQSSPEDSKKAASQLENLSDKAPDSMKERITKTAEALRGNAEEALRDSSDDTGELKEMSTTIRALKQVLVDTTISEYRDVCSTAS